MTSKDLFKFFVNLLGCICQLGEALPNVFHLLSLVLLSGLALRLPLVELPDEVVTCQIVLKAYVGIGIEIPTHS